MSESVIRCQGIAKTYQDGELKVDVLLQLDFSVKRGEQVAIVGPSGSGKSTLLHILGGLDTVSQGEVFIHEQNIWQQTEAKRCGQRNKQLGFVYQFHHLLPEFSALENVMFPLAIGATKLSEARWRAKACLDRLGLKARYAHKPAQLSGGERQRVAIARAMVNQPAVILADEPTGNLDAHTAESVYQALLELNREQGTSLVIVTHDKDLAAKMDRQYELVDGALVAR